MKAPKPKLFEITKGYSKKQLIKDVVAGIIVAIIALPLSIALAIASGVKPEAGLYTAIVAGFFISMLGGSRVQIGGPTAAFVVIIYGIVQQFGTDGLVIATIMAGVMLVIMGFCGLGTLIRYIPQTITMGFTCGIGVTLFVGQLKDFLGLGMENVPSEFIEKIIAYANNFETINWLAVGVGALAVVIMKVMPKITDKVPGSLVAIIATTLIVKLCNLNVNTIGSVYGQLSSQVPLPQVPAVTFDMVTKLISPAFTIALLAGIESLLSCVVSDGMIGDRHNSNAELVGQGVGNIMSGIFGGIPATGAIARTAANAKNGGRSPISGMIHSVTLLVILLVLMPTAALIPMTTLAAVLMVVASNMCDWKAFFHMAKAAPKSDAAILIVTFGLTVIFDLVIAIEIGVVLSALLLMRRMAEVTGVKAWKYIEQADVKEGEAELLMKVPKEIRVYEITGPLFFAATDTLSFINVKTYTRVVILRMRSVPALDVSAAVSLEKLADEMEKKGVRLIFSHLNEQPMSVLKKEGLVKRLGAESFRKNIMDAVEFAEGLVSEAVTA